jgi:hypothetical protein
MERKLTTADVCQVSGYSRDHIQALLKVLPPYCDSLSSERVARHFRSQDLLVICVARTLEINCGVRRKDIAKIGDELHRTLNGPRRLSETPVLVINVSPPKVQYLETLFPEVDGIVIQLRPLFDRVDMYLMGETYQSALNFGSGLRAVTAVKSEKRHAKQ